MDRPVEEKKRSWLWLPGLAAVIAIAMYFVVPYLVGPPLPKKVVIATGSKAGVYFKVAQQYRELLAEDGVELEIRNTKGSVENLDLLRDDTQDISVAIVQGGTNTDSSDKSLRSLASIYLEPVWVFYRADLGDISMLSELDTARVGVGPEGSGTRAIALEMLTANGMLPDPNVATVQPTEFQNSRSVKLHDISGRAAADALIANELDAAFFVIGPSAGVIKELLASKDIRLMSFRRATAYETRHRYLESIDFTQGMLDLEQDLPSQDKKLLAATACLVAREDIHPAITLLLLQAATEVHEAGGFFEPPGQFPSALGVDLPLSKDASRFLKNGPSLLYRYFPFQMANWLDRMKLLLVPLATLLLPLFKAFPPIYRWRIRSKIYRWYTVLREIDQKLADAQEGMDYSEDIQRLETLQTELAEVSVPLSYMEEFYNLRLHVNYVAELLSHQPTEKTQSTDNTKE